MSLKHRQARKQDYLVFDHLMPPSPHLKEFVDWYVTDLSFDAFQWNENQLISKEILTLNLLKFSKDLLMTPINNLRIDLLITV